MKPHEETWEAFVSEPPSTSCWLDLADKDGWHFAEFCDGAYPRDLNEARAKLAAQAPAMARLLIEIAERLWGPQFPDLYDAGSGTMSGKVKRVLKAAGVLP